jgi:2-polyprenyl-3-methyl-5-hydroxy-6-metoxy-1,4-benzoquinol methylase
MAIKETNPKRLHILRQVSSNKMIRYRESFLQGHKINVEKFKNHLTKKRACPVCNKKNYKKIFTKKGGTFVKCNECTMIYLNPIFKDKHLIKYYKNNTDIQSEAHIRSKKFYKDIYQDGIKFIQKKIKLNKKKILDIGCSSGLFLDIVKQYGAYTYGIELNSSEYKIAKKKHKIFNTTIDKIDIEEKFDLITLWDVFEHIPEPYSFIKNIRKKLKKNGIIFFQIPNSNSLAAKILRKECNVFDPIEHVNLYNINSFKILAKKLRIKILNIKSIISEIMVIKNYLEYNEPYFSENFKTYKDSNFINEKNIHNNFLGYKLQIIARAN